MIQSPKGSDTHNKWDAGVRLGDSEIRSAFCKVETGEKVAITINYIHPILLDDEFSRQQICGRKLASPCIPSQVRAGTTSDSQSSSARILSFLRFTPAKFVQSKQVP